MLFGHTAKVLCLVDVSETSETHYVVSASEKELCLWNVLEGMCVEMVQSTLVHTHLQVSTLPINRCLFASAFLQISPSTYIPFLEWGTFSWLISSSKLDALSPRHQYRKWLIFWTFWNQVKLNWIQEFTAESRFKYSKILKYRDNHQVKLDYHEIDIKLTS